MQKLRSAREQLLSGLIHLFRNSCVALFFLCDKVLLSQKLCISFLMLQDAVTIAVGLAIWLDNAHRQDGGQKGTGLPRT